MGSIGDEEKMRALFLKGASLEPLITITDKADLHYLQNVLRLKAEEEILLLNGLGLKGLYCIELIQKKSIVLKQKEVKEEKQHTSISLLLGAPKKEYLEECFRSAIQFGVENIYLWETDRTPQKVQLKPDRVDKILKGAYEQSNNPFELKIKLFDELELKNYEHKLLLGVKPAADDVKIKINKKNKILLAIGPEGGFTDSEVTQLLSQGFEVLHFPTPILKTIEALPAAIGAILGASMVDAL